MKIKVAIIGYGLVGNRRKFFIERNRKYKLKYISDIKFKKKFSRKNIDYFNNHKEIPTENIDAVFVTLPNSYAPSISKYFLKRNIHVFCEKPPAKTLKEVLSLNKFYKKLKNIKLKYGFNHRYHLSVQKAKAILSKNTLGKIIIARGVYGKSRIINFSKNNWRSKKKEAGGGILLDQGIHMLDLLRYLVGDFNEYKSFISNKYWNYDVEDNAFALMRNESGIIASIHSTATQWQHKFSLEIICSKGSLLLDGILSGTKTYGKEKLKIFPGSQPYLHLNNAKTKTFNFYIDPSWKQEVDEFADVILKNKKVREGTIDDAIAVMRMVESIYKNDTKGIKYEVSKRNL